MLNLNLKEKKNGKKRIQVLFSYQPLQSKLQKQSLYSISVHIFHSSSSFPRYPAGKHKTHHAFATVFTSVHAGKIVFILFTDIDTIYKYHFICTSIFTSKNLHAHTHTSFVFFPYYPTAM